jgi:hypothetical protein
MLIETIKMLFTRDLDRLKSEITLYQNENNIWKIQEGIANSGGNLCLHLLGNLNTYIGAEFGKTGYVRNRPAEFSLKDISRAELLSKIEETTVVVYNALNTITEENLKMEYPHLVLKDKTSTEFLLIHLTTHLAYHLGQINYHIRLLEA